VFPLVIRRAHAGDAQTLTRIARSAKAHWGYSPQQVQAWRAELEVSMASLQWAPTFVGEISGTVAGFYQLRVDTDPPLLDHLWVEPAHMGLGLGSALVRHALALLAADGISELAIDADPHAEGFYLGLGARRVGEIAAPLAGQPDRVRPQLRLSALS
jgi:GNAT superfamily N-acetyltransferase